ncbi:MAG: Glutamine synthetase type I, partial [uncultured Thermomicrobiales bacterium]
GNGGTGTASGQGADERRHPEADHRRGDRVRQPPVHRRDGDGQERDRARQDLRPHRRRRAMDRRLLDRRLHPDRRVGHVPPAGSLHVPDPALGARRLHHRAGDLLGPQPQRRPVSGRSARRPDAPAREAGRARLRLHGRAGAGVLPLREERRRDRPPAARPRRLLRLLDRPRLHDPQGHGPPPGPDGDRGRGQPPRGRRRPARDRFRVRSGDPDRGPGPDVQVRPEGDRPEARPPRDLHAQAAGGDQRLRDARPPEPALPGRRQERLRRRRRPLRLVQGRQALHRRPARPRPRPLRGDRAAGQLLPPPGARLRSPGLRRLGADQPLGPDPGPGNPRRPHRRDPDRAALPGSELQPLPRLRGDAGGRDGRDPERDGVAGAGGGEPLPLHRRRPEAAQRADPAGHPRRGGRRDGGRPGGPRGPRRPRLRAPGRGPARRVGRIPPPRLLLGTGTVPGGLL